VAPVYRFLLMLRNGEAADPPAFLTEQRRWKPGDVFVAANGRAFRLVDTDAEVEAGWHGALRRALDRGTARGVGTADSGKQSGLGVRLAAAPFLRRAVAGWTVVRIRRAVRMGAQAPNRCQRRTFRIPVRITATGRNGR
jgi:hypothetical protein